MATGDVVQSLLLKATDLRDDTDHMHVVSVCTFVFLLCLCIVLGHLLEENRWMNESITALLLVSMVDQSVLGLQRKPKSG